MEKSFFKILWNKHRSDEIFFHVIFILGFSLVVSFISYFEFVPQDPSRVSISYKNTDFKYDRNGRIDLSKEDEGIEVSGIDEDTSIDYFTSENTVLLVLLSIFSLVLLCLIYNFIRIIRRKFELGINVIPYYLSIPKDRLAIQIESEIKKGKIVYADSNYKDGERVLLKALASSYFIILEDYLLMIPNDNYCHVFPLSEIVWIGPIKSTEMSDTLKSMKRAASKGIVFSSTTVSYGGKNDYNKDIYKVVVYTKDDVFGVNMSEKRSLFMADKLLNLIIKNSEKSRSYLKTALGETTDEFELSKRLETLFYNDSLLYKAIVNNLLCINKMIEENDTNEVNHTSV
jgi:hypothetical protein